MFVDTCFCIDLMREHKRGFTGPATRKLNVLSDCPLYLPLFVLCELQAGARVSSMTDAELGRVERICDLMEVVLPDRTFATSYGQNEAIVRRSGSPIPTMDLLIGTLAQQHGLPLLTRDAGHYGRIPQLVLECYGEA